MKKLLLALLLFPLLCNAQSDHIDILQENRIDAATGDSIMHTYWFVLARATIGDPLNLFFRITRINNEYFLDVKAMDAGDNMVIARGEPLDLLLDDGNKIRLYNSEYEASCIGCGARGYAGSDAQGVLLTYPIYKADLQKLQYRYPDKVRLYNADGYWYKRIDVNNSDVFIHEINLISNSRARN